MFSQKIRFKDLSEDAFLFILNQHLMPSSPIRSEELLKGRQVQLEKVRKSLLSPGRSVFIHGLRGVGKTSLAQTAANLFQTSDAEPITFACEKNSKFSQCIKNICSKLVNETPNFTSKSKSNKFGVASKYISIEHAESIQQGRIPSPGSVDEAIGLVKYCSDNHSKLPVIVIDEFDRIIDGSQRSIFGDFVKQVGDQNLKTKFIFCGVGDSLDELLADHESAYRYFASISLDRLGIGPCMEIIEEAASKVGIEIDRNYLLRAAWISDGFPHFTHLIGEKLLWQAFEDPKVIDSITSDVFTNAILEAVQDVEQHLKAIYDKATKKYGDDYQYVLWAASDHPDMVRRSIDIYESYLRIMKDLGEEAISRDLFNNRMNSLKKKSHGEILSAIRTGWYRFSNPMLRGYCRLKAQSRGIVLGREHFLEEKKIQKI